MNMKNSLQKRTPVQNLQMTVGTACAMGTAAMMSTVMAYADVSTAIDKVFNVGNQVSNSIAKGLTNVVVPIGIAVFLYLLVRMLLARKNSLQKRTPVQNLQMTVGTACAMGTAAMMSTVMAYADVSTAIDKVFNVGNQVSNSIAKGLTNVVVPIGIAVFLYLLVRMLLASDPKDVQTYKKRLIVVAIIVVAAVAVPGLMKVANELGGQINGELGGNNIGGNNIGGNNIGV